MSIENYWKAYHVTLERLSESHPANVQNLFFIFSVFVTEKIITDTHYLNDLPSERSQRLLSTLSPQLHFT